MVLLGIALRVTQALCLPSFAILFCFASIFGASEKDTYHFRGSVPTVRHVLMHMADFPQTETMILSDVYPMNHWIINILGLAGRWYCFFSLFIGAKSYLFTTLVMQFVHSFLRPRKREPPDPTSVLFPEGVCTGNENRKSCFDTKVELAEP